MRAHDEDDDSHHFRPDAWKAACEATQDVQPPPGEVKAAAERLAGTENLQQAMGWMVLTQIGVLLGSFGPTMTVEVALLSWAVFMLEAMLKFARNWAHKRFFMDVPCAYVPMHEPAAHSTLAIFERSIKSAALLEVALFVPYIVVVCRFLLDTKLCVHGEDSPDCTQGSNVLAYLLLFCITTVFCHGMTSLVTLWAFDSAMGGGKLARIQRRMRLNSSSWDNASGSNSRGSEGRKWFRAPRSNFDRVLCLTWWVHMARHRHLSAVVASAQPGNCGLPGHWFEGVGQLKRFVEWVVDAEAGEHVPHAAGPLGVSQDMALRALVSLSKLGMEKSSEILKNKGFDLLVRVVREGKILACRGLAAKVIGILSAQHEAIRKEKVNVAVAVIPLRRLARSKDYDLKEIALGALLNTALNDDQFPQVLAQMECSDGIVEGSTSTFACLLMEHARSGPTPRCQELAIGLLARLAGERQFRSVLVANDGERQIGVQMLIALLEHGLTTEMKASAAGVLSELAFKEGRAIGRGPHGESSIRALIHALQGEPRIAYASARAVCNLALNFRDIKPKIISAQGVERFVYLLAKKVEVEHQDYQMQEQVQAEAARALWIMALNNSENQQIIVRAMAQNSAENQQIMGKTNALDSLVDLLSNPCPKVYIQAVAALSGIAWKMKEIQDLIGQESTRIFPRMVRLLDDKDDEKMEEKVLEKVAVAFRSFADGNKSNQKLLVKEGALRALQNISGERGHKYKEKTMLRVREATNCLTEDAGESS